MNITVAWLLIFTAYGHRPAVVVHSFGSERACMVALAEVEARTQSRKLDYQKPICLPITN